MPNIKSAKKRALQTEVRRKINTARKSSIKTAIKKVMAALKSQEDVAVVKDLMRDAEAKIARGKGKGVLHFNTAARTIGRLAKRVAAAQKAA